MVRKRKGSKKNKNMHAGQRMKVYENELIFICLRFHMTLSSCISVNSLVFRSSQLGYPEFVPIVISRHDSVKVFTLSETNNIAPENWWLDDEFPFGALNRLSSGVNWLLVSAECKQIPSDFPQLERTLR